MVKNWQKKLVISCGLLILIILGLALFVYSRNEHKAIIPEGECPSTIAYWVGLPPLETLARDTPLIILGEVKDSSWDSPKIKVTESLKGKYFNKGDVIDLCPGLLGLDQPERSVILFIVSRHAQDGRVQWGTFQATNGIALEKDGKFQVYTDDQKDMFSLEEIQEAIAKSRN